MLTDVRDVLRALEGIDTRAAVHCAAVCARTVLPLVPPPEIRPRCAVEAAEAWARGEIGRTVFEDAAGEAEAAADAHDESDTDNWPAIGAARAAMGTYAALLDPFCFTFIHHDLGAVATNAAGAWAADRGGGSRLRQHRDPHLARMLDLVLAQRWPRIVPTPHQLSRVDGAVRVAWDFVALRTRPDHTIAQLIAAHGRARAVGLDWRDPVHRAAAERTGGPGLIAPGHRRRPG